MPAIVDPLTQAFEPILGQIAWGADNGQGSILSFDFGEPHLAVTEPYVSTSRSPDIRKRAARRHVRPSGAWFLFVFCCHWRIAMGGEPMASDASDKDAMRAAAREVDGQKLVAVELDALQRTTTFRFDLGATLLTWPSEDSQDAEDEQWDLFMPGGDVLTYRSDGRFSWERGDTRPDAVIWHALPSDRRHYVVALPDDPA